MTSRGGKRSAADCLGDIVLWGDRLARHLADVNLDAFLDDEKAQDAASKCVEAIGEAAGRLLETAPDLERQCPELQLRQAYRTRNRLAHGYFDLDQALLWRTCTQSVPQAVEAARRLLGDQPP